MDRSSTPKSRPGPGPKFHVFSEEEGIRLLKNRTLVARLWKEYHAGDPWYANWTDVHWRSYAGSRAALLPPNAEPYLHIFEATPVDDRCEFFADPGSGAARPCPPSGAVNR